MEQLQGDKLKKLKPSPSPSPSKEENPQKVEKVENSKKVVKDVNSTPKGKKENKIKKSTPDAKLKKEETKDSVESPRHIISPKTEDYNSEPMECNEDSPIKSKSKLNRILSDSEDELGSEIKPITTKTNPESPEKKFSIFEKENRPLRHEQN